MVDMRREFDSLTKEYGSNMMLVRLNKKRPCKCLDSLYGSARSECPICLGTGYTNKVEKVLGRHSTSAASAKSPDATPAGDILDASNQFYLRYDVRPEIGDVMVVCEWDGDVPVFDEYAEVYKLNYVEPIRGDGGRIEYFIGYAAYQPTQMKAILHSIERSAGSINYYITVR
jgi:hypothetical protein